MGSVEISFEKGGSLSSSNRSCMSRREQATKTESAIWNVVAFILVGITLLYTCDTLQINHITKKGIHNDAFAEDVVIKTTQSPMETSEARGTTPPTTMVGSQTVAAVPPTKASSSDIGGDSMFDDNHGFDKKYPPFVSILKNGDVEYYTYTKRARVLDKDAQQELINRWGQWNFTGHRSLLSEDFYQSYPNRDVPRKEFPAHAWQIDKGYLSGFLSEALALVQRAQDAILAEYGQPSSDSWEERAKMFAIDYHNENLEGTTLKDNKGNAIVNEGGGWTTPESWKVLKRRLLHAVMTEDSFVFAMGGHSSSAGHGNHFQQSYTLQVQWILEAVFARLGVRHQARNFGNGGLGTVQNGMGSGSVYGPDVGKPICWL
jgi:hypothetical protein